MSSSHRAEVIMKLFEPIFLTSFLEEPYLDHPNGILIDCLEHFNELFYLIQIRVFEILLINLSGLVLVNFSRLKLFRSFVFFTFVFLLPTLLDFLADVFQF